MPATTIDHETALTGRAPGRTEQPLRRTTLPPGFAGLLPELNKQPWKPRRVKPMSRVSVSRWPSAP